MLRGQFRNAMGIVHNDRRNDPDNPIYARFADQSQAALEQGAFNTPLLVAAFATWSAPCRVMKSMLQRMDGINADIVFLDADEDPELLNQLEITALPSLVWTVDGKKQSELVGKASETQVLQFIQQAQVVRSSHHTDLETVDQTQHSPADKQRLRELPFDVLTVDIPAARAFDASLAESAPVDSNRTLNFYVGFTR